jgi:hypothetical protein
VVSIASGTATRLSKVATLSRSIPSSGPTVAQSVWRTEQLERLAEAIEHDVATDR